MLLNPTGGTFGGDRLRTEVILGAGTHVVLTTPSASKIYRAVDDAARCETKISLGEDAILEYLPDHLIPHPGASLRQILAVTMARSSRAIIYDAMAAGRVGRDERWKFREIASEISIRSGGALRVLTRSSLIPGSQPVQGLGLMEGFDYLGSIIAVGAQSQTITQDLREIDAAMSSIPDVRGGASALAGGGFIAKFLASNAHALTLAMRAGWSVARQQLIGLPGFDLRKA
jgi:urease accessory protein